MKAVVIQKYRSPVVVNDLMPAQINEFQVRIKTAYAGLSFTDRIIQQGLYSYQRKHMRLPYTPGFEASGIVIEVGKSVSSFKVGDRVIVLQRLGCLCSEIITEPDSLIKLPNEIDLSWAASLPVNFFTASHALNNIVKIFPNSNLLVTSAAGGVGGMLIQLASEGHSVTGLVGKDEKKQYVSELGAQSAYTYSEFFKQNKKFDVIFVASGEDLKEYVDRLNKNGKMIVYGFHSMVPKNFKGVLSALLSYLQLPSVNIFRMVYQNKTISGFNIICLDSNGVEFQAVKKHLVERLANGNLPNRHKIQVYGLNRVNDAYNEIASGNTQGKVVIEF